MNASVEVILRDVVPSDLEVLFEHQADPEGARLAAFRSRDRASFLAHWSNLLADAALLKKAIVVNGTVIGNIGVFGPPGHREVGYWLGRDHWGKGLATQALRELLRTMSERPLYAHVAQHNRGSIRVLEKCGFELVGDQPDFAGAEGARVHGAVYRID